MAVLRHQCDVSGFLGQLNPQTLTPELERARGVEGEPARDPADLVENPDVEVGDEGDDATPGVAASE